MHEAGVAERILEVVVQRASAAGAVRVTDVYLAVGEESGVDTEAIALHWPILSAASIAQGARLHFEAVSEPRAFRLTAVEVTEAAPSRTGRTGTGRLHDDRPCRTALTALSRAPSVRQAGLGRTGPDMLWRMVMEATTKGPMARLLTWLAESGIDHEIHEHERTFTAPATARAEGVEPGSFEKVVWVRSAEGGDALMVLDANDHLDLRKAREVLKAGRVKLVPEAEIEQLAPDCEPGAMPAVGSLYDLPTYADHGVRDRAEVSFNAGSHRYAVRVDREAWEKAAGVIYADLAVDTWREPAWARS